jgi:hypothetical protein
MAEKESGDSFEGSRSRDCQSLRRCRAEGAATEISYAEARATKVPARIPVTLLSATEDQTMPAEAHACGLKAQGMDRNSARWEAPGCRKNRTLHSVQQPKLVIDTIRETLNQKR